MPKAGAYAVRKSVHQEVQPIGAPLSAGGTRVKGAWGTHFGGQVAASGA